MLAPTISVDSRGVGVLAPTIIVDSERHGASIFMLAVTISVDWQRHAVQLQIDTDGSNQQETPANGGAARFLLLGVGVLAPTISVDSDTRCIHFYVGCYHQSRFATTRRVIANRH